MNYWTIISGSMNCSLRQGNGCLSIAGLVGTHAIGCVTANSDGIPAGWLDWYVVFGEGIGVLDIGFSVDTGSCL